MPVNPNDRLFEEKAFRSDKAVTRVTAATTLKSHQRNVLITLPSSSSYVITLPPVTECFGIYVFFVDIDGAGTASVADSDEALVDYTSGNLTAQGDFLILFCNGLQWFELKELTT